MRVTSVCLLLWLTVATLVLRCGCEEAAQDVNSGLGSSEVGSQRNEELQEAKVLPPLQREVVSNEHSEAVVEDVLVSPIPAPPLAEKTEHPPENQETMVTDQQVEMEAEKPVASTVEETGTLDEGAGNADTQTDASVDTLSGEVKPAVPRVEPVVQASTDDAQVVSGHQETGVQQLSQTDSQDKEGNLPEIRLEMVPHTAKQDSMETDSKADTVHKDEKSQPTVVDSVDTSITTQPPLVDDDKKEPKPPVADDTQDTLDDFEEWKKKRKPDIGAEVVVEPVTDPNKLIRSGKKLTNFANQECGAKVIAWNPESKNAPYLLSENKDEYMINPCSNKKWFVVQLCEAVEQIHVIELANLELFSSIPETFRVHISDRYPTKEWSVPLGTFHAKDERGIQSFAITTNSQLYAKYVKFEMLTHYGSEHYCPLSLLRIYATSVEDFDDGDTDGSNVDDKTSEGVKEVDDAPSNLFTTTADTVLSLVKSVLSPVADDAKADVSNGTAGIVPNSTYYLPNTNFTKEGFPLPCDPERNSDIDNATSTLPSADNVEENNTEVEAVTDIPGDLAPVVTKLADHEQQPVDISLPSIVTLVEAPLKMCPVNKNLNFYRCLVCDASVSHTRSDWWDACGYARALDASCCRAPMGGVKDRRPVLDAVHDEGINVSTTHEPAGTGYSESSEGDASSSIISEGKTVSENENTVLKEQLVVDHSTVEGETIAVEVSNTAASVSIEPEDVAKEISVSVLDEGSVENPQDAVLATKSSNIQETVISALPSVNDNGALDEKSDFDKDAEIGGSDIPAIKSSAPDVEEAVSMETPILEPSTETVTQVNQEEAVKTVETQRTEDVVNPTKEKETIDSENPHIIYAHNTTVQKEDADIKHVAPPATLIKKLMPKRDVVIMKLSNNIRQLEANLSLTNLYLQELSQKYRKQREEMQRALNWTMEKLMNTSRESENKEVEHNTEMQKVKESISEMAVAVKSMSEKMNHFQEDIISRHIVLVVIEMLFMAFMLVLCVRRSKKNIQNDVPPISERVLQKHLLTPQRHARNNSSDGTVGYEPPIRSLQKRAVSYGNLSWRDDFDGDITIIEPLDVFSTETIPHASGPKRKKKKKSQAKLFHSKSGSDIIPLEHVQSSRSDVSSAGVLFGAHNQGLAKDLAKCSKTSNGDFKGFAPHRKIASQDIGKPFSTLHVPDKKKLKNTSHVMKNGKRPFNDAFQGKKDRNGLCNGGKVYTSNSCGIEAVGESSQIKWKSIYGANKQY